MIPFWFEAWNKFSVTMLLQVDFPYWILKQQPQMRQRSLTSFFLWCNLYNYNNRHHAGMLMQNWRRGNFPMKFDNGLSTLLSNFILAVKFNWIISFLQFGIEVKKLLRFELANFLAALPLTRMHAQATTNMRLLVGYRLYKRFNM